MFESFPPRIFKKYVFFFNITLFPNAWGAPGYIFHIYFRVYSSELLDFAPLALLHRTKGLVPPTNANLLKWTGDC